MPAQITRAVAGNQPQNTPQRGGGASPRLSEAHRQMLEHESGIRPEVIKQRGYSTITVKADLRRRGFTDRQCRTPALLIPIHSPRGEVVLYQARPDSPRVGKNGKSIKYETPKGARMVLDVHPSTRDKLGDLAGPLFITEGIKKGDALTSRGLCTVALLGVYNFRGRNEHGGKTALAEWEDIALNDGRKVYIVFDSDVMEKRAVYDALVRLKAFLESRGADVRLIYLPASNGGSKCGVDDYLAAGHSVDDLLSLAAPELRQPSREAEAENGLPSIETSGRYMREITSDALAALEQANIPPALFMRGGKAARVDGEGRAELLNYVILKGRLDRVANFVQTRFKEGEPVVSPSRPPGDVAADILALPSLPFPRLNTISPVPVFLPDGRLLKTDGYDADTGILLRLGGLSVRADVPLEEAKRWLLEELLGEFPFTADAGIAHTVAAALQPFVRPMIAGPAPLFLFDAPTPGTGKGKIPSVISIVVTGDIAPVMALPRDNDELDKRITATLMAGYPVNLLDNVNALMGDKLSALFTAAMWRGRLLGKSEILTLRNDALWAATGNNVEMSDEMGRRVMPVRLDAQMEHPEERGGFRHSDLEVWASAHRAELVSACLSLVQSWVDAGMPQGAQTLGSFEAWCAVMGGILEHCGIPGFLGDRERLRAQADRESAEWRSLCEMWHKTHGETPITAKELLEVAREYGFLLDTWTGRSALSAQQRLGHALSKKRNRVFGKWAICPAGRDGHSNSAAYRLAAVADKPRKPAGIQVMPSQKEDNPAGLENETPAKPAQNPGRANLGSGNPPKPAQNPQGESAVTDGETDMPTGVSGVLNRPRERSGEAHPRDTRFKDEAPLFDEETPWGGSEAEDEGGPWEMTL